MFDFEKFYNNLLAKIGVWDFEDRWKDFPKEELMRFKSQTLALLKKNIAEKDSRGLQCTIAVLFYDGADEEYTDLLLEVMDEPWHLLNEDIVGILYIIKDPKSVDKLYETAVNIPEDDEMRALAKKCLWALGVINTPEAKDKILELQKLDDEIIKEFATFQLESVIPT